MKKKKMIMILIVGTLVSSLLTGCAGNEEATNADGESAVITESATSESAEKATEVSSEPETTEAEKTETETTETESETVETQTEEVIEDFLSKNGFVITPQGSLSMNLTESYETDETKPFDVAVSITTAESDEEGYSDTTAIFTVTLNGSVGIYLTAFDRYTGTCFESGLGVFESDETGVHHENVSVIDVDGKQYDCGFSVEEERPDNQFILKVTVHHPSDYDGVVFQFGKNGLAQQTEISKIDYSKSFTIDQYPVLLEEQYYFTVSDI